MSLKDTLRSLFAPAEQGRPLHQAPGRAGVVLDGLRSVVDPEVGLDIVNMGLIRGLELDGDTAHLRMTLTTPGCPVAAELMAEVQEVLNELGYHCELEMEMQPPWSPEHISEAGRRALNEG